MKGYRGICNNISPFQDQGSHTSVFLSSISFGRKDERLLILDGGSPISILRKMDIKYTKSDVVGRVVINILKETEKCDIVKLRNIQIGSKVYGEMCFALSENLSNEILGMDNLMRIVPLYDYKNRLLYVHEGGKVPFYPTLIGKDLNKSKFYQVRAGEITSKGERILSLIQITGFIEYDSETKSIKNYPGLECTEEDLSNLVSTGCIYKLGNLYTFNQ